MTLVPNLRCHKLCVCKVWWLKYGYFPDKSTGKSRYLCRSPARMKTTAVVFISLPGVQTVYCGIDPCVLVSIRDLLKCFTDGEAYCYHVMTSLSAAAHGNIFWVACHLCGELFPAQRPVTRGFDVSLICTWNKRLSKQSAGWWFETPLHIMTSL